MKKNYLTILSILITVAVSACGPTPEPTMSAADLQGTAIANAWIAITQTQAAIPTATQTPVPPTPTITLEPLPTATLLLVPPLALLPAATLPVTATTDTCNDPPPIKPKGTVVNIKFVNKTDSSLNLSFAMAQENSLKECGTYSFTLARYDEPVVQVLAGCYWAYAWVLDPPSNAQSPEALCVTDTSKAIAIWITKEVIGFH